MQSDGHFELCSCGESHDHFVAHRQTADGWPVTGWSNHALELKSAAPEAGAVTHRGTVLFVADVWPVLDVVELLDANEVGRIVQGRTLVPPAPPAVEVRS